MAKYRVMIEYEYPEKEIPINNNSTMIGHYRPDDVIVKIGCDFVSATVLDNQMAVMQEEDYDDFQPI